MAFWVATVSPVPAVVFALYLWPALFGTVVLIEFWRLLSDAYALAEAKRVFGTISAGATAGALAGSAAATAMTAAFEVRHLLLTSSIAMAAAAVLVTRLPIPPASQEPEAAAPGPERRFGSLGLIGSHPYVLRLVCVLLMVTVTITLADYVFKSVAARYVDPAELGSFFARVALALSVAALAVQLIATGPLLERIGILRLFALLPLTLAATGGLVAAGAGLLGVLAMRIGDGTLRHSIHRTTAELLYVPLSPRMRAEIKPLVDVGTHRGGQVIGSGLILAALTLGADERWLAGAVAVAAGAALAITAGMRASYLDLFRRVLDRDATETRLAYPALDLLSLRSLVAALNSEDDRQVIAALNILEAQQQVNLIPALILFHPSRRVVLAALETFARSARSDFLWIAERLRQEGESSEVRAAALRAVTLHRPDRAILAVAIEDHDPVVRATAMVGLVAGGWLPERDAVERLGASGAGSVEHLAVAAALTRQPSPAWESLPIALVQSSDPAVRAETARAMGRIGRVAFLPWLRSLLGDRTTREAARDAFVAIGSPSVGFLRESLANGSLPRAIRLHLPRTISRFPPDQSAPILIERLAVEEDRGVRYKVLRGLGRLRMEAPDLTIDGRQIDRAINRTLEAALQLRRWRHGLAVAPRRATERQRLLTDFLADEQARAIEELFRLLGLQQPRERFDRIFKGLGGGPIAQASSLELVEHLVDPARRAAVLSLLNGQTSEAADRSALETTLQAVIRDSSGVLRELAAAALAERQGLGS